jgi:signal transduction histidine kinase
MFRRGSNVSDKDGIGVGLSVVKRIVELHFGSIEVESEPAHGTTFLFSLPAEQISLEA